MQKISFFDTLRRQKDLSFEITVDGNVSYEHAPKMIAHGADILVVGTSSVFIKGQSLTEGIRSFKNHINHTGEKTYHAAYTGY